MIERNFFFGLVIVVLGLVALVWFWTWADGEISSRETAAVAEASTGRSYWLEESKRVCGPGYVTIRARETVCVPYKLPDHDP